MKTLLTLTLVLLLAGSACADLGAHSGWVEGSVIGVDADAPRAIVLFRLYLSPDGSTFPATAPVTWFPPEGFTGAPNDPLASVGDFTASPYEQNQVNTVDVSAFVPPDTKAVLLSNIYIITHGSTEQGCGIRIWFRAHGAEWGHMNGQVAAANVGENARTNDTQIVPIRNGAFDFYWIADGTPGWPAGCAFGINSGLAGYIR